MIYLLDITTNIIKFRIFENNIGKTFNDKENSRFL